MFFVLFPSKYYKVYWALTSIHIRIDTQTHNNNNNNNNKESNSFNYHYTICAYIIQYCVWWW